MRTVTGMQAVQRLVIGAVLATACGACADAIDATAVPVRPTFEQDGEHMPGPASVWVTSEPGIPTGPVRVTMTSPSDPGVRFGHTFAAGVPLRGDFATSQGDYRLAAFDGACILDVRLGPSRTAEVVLVVHDTGCVLVLRRVGDMGDPAMQHGEDAVLIVNGGANETPFVEPQP